MSNLALQLVKSELFEGNKVDIYHGNNSEFYMTIRQLAKTLGYASKNGIELLLNRNPKLKNEEFSTTYALKVLEGNRTVKREMRVFTEDGIYEVAFKSETAVSENFRHWVRKTLKQIREQNHINPEEILKGNQDTETNNDTIQTIFSKLNNLEERFNTLQQEKNQDLEIIATLENSLYTEKKQIHKNPVIMKRSRIYEELKTNLFFEEFNNPVTADTYNLALTAIKDLTIDEIKNFQRQFDRMNFNGNYNSIQWAIYVLKIGYIHLHNAKGNIYYNKAIEKIRFNKKVSEEFCEKYLFTYAPCDKHSLLHDNIINKLPQKIDFKEKSLRMQYWKYINVETKEVIITLNPTHMKIDNSITLNEYLTMIDITVKAVQGILRTIKL